MRREAIEVFYHDAYFDLYNDDLGSTLSFLRDVIPREGLVRLRRIRFTMTVAQCEGWAGGAVDSGYPAAMLETQVAVPYWGGGPAPRRDHKADWWAVVALLAGRADLPRLTVSVEMGECAWAFVEDTLMWPDPPDLSMFRFIYDFYVDVVTAMCALKGLSGLNLDLGAFQQLKPWFEREVLGYARERTGLSPRARRLEQDLWRRPRFYQVVPPWHDVDQILEGSNYHTHA